MHLFKIAKIFLSLPTPPPSLTSPRQAPALPSDNSCVKGMTCCTHHDSRMSTVGPQRGPSALLNASRWEQLYFLMGQLIWAFRNKSCHFNKHGAL